MKTDAKIALGTLGLIVVGEYLLHRVQVLSHSMYPMLDAVTPDPRYDPSLHRLLFYMSLGWFFVCILLGALAASALRKSR